MAGQPVPAARPPAPVLRHRKLAAGGAIGIVALATAAIVVTSSPSSSPAASSSSAPAGSTSVERRNLVSTDTESGTLSYANPHTVFNRLSGTITWLPAVGQVIKPGQTLYDVNNAPVTLLDGTTPAYRDLSSADASGPDVLELNRDLRALGFDPSNQIALEDTWQTATTDAVDRWQGSLGETETGVISLGQVVFLPGTQRVTAIDSVLGSTGGAGGGSSSSPSTSTSATGASVVVRPKPEFVSLATTTSTVPTTTTTPSRPTTPARPKSPSKKSSSSNANAELLKAMAALLKAESAQLRASKSSSPGAAKPSASTASAGTASHGGSPSSSASAPASSGATGGANAQAIMQTSATQLIVTVPLDASKQSEAVLGAPVTVQMPDGSTVNGRITAVSPVAQASSSSTGSGAGASGSTGSSSSTATVPVTITLTSRLVNSRGLDQAAVSVNFEQQRANNVLSVPVTALLATQGGGYAVQEASSPHKLLAVTPGLFAAGYVQISGPGIYPGLEVTDSQG